MSDVIIVVSLLWVLFGCIYAMAENYNSSKFTKTFCEDLVSFLLWPVTLIFYIGKGIITWFKGLR
jgi:hypothetical protein